MIGTEMDEIDIVYFLKLQKRGGASRNGQMYFVNPHPSRSFKFKVKKYGGYIIEMTCKEFAEWLVSTIPKVDSKSKHSRHFLENFGYVSVYRESSKNIHYDDSKLYFGYSPNWKDIIFDWDFKSVKIEDIFHDILRLESSNDEYIAISLICKTLSGKSVFLKRLAYYLHADGFEVYEYIGREFNYKSYIDNSTKSSNNRIVLGVDLGSSYYSSISKLLSDFPKNK